jgi:hypothetical protein
VTTPVGGTFRGAWATATRYLPGDILHYLGTTYTVTTAFMSGSTFSTTNLSSVVNTTSGHLTAAVVGTGLSVKEGSGAKMGAATLAAGTVTVANTNVTSSSRILVTSNTDGGTPGWLRVSAKVAGTSFTITSSSNTDTSTVAWLICEPA